MYSPSSSGIAVIWGRGDCIGPNLTRKRHSFSPLSLWEGQGMEHWWVYLMWHRERALLSTATSSSNSHFLFGGCCYCHQFRSEGRDLPWRLPSSWDGGFTPLLVCVCLGLVSRQWRHFLPPPPLCSPRMTFIDHAMSTWYSPGGYGTLIPSFPHLELHTPLMWYEGHYSLDVLRVMGAGSILGPMGA